MRNRLSPFIVVLLAAPIGGCMWLDSDPGTDTSPIKRCDEEVVPNDDVDSATPLAGIDDGVERQVTTDSTIGRGDVDVFSLPIANTTGEPPEVTVELLAGPGVDTLPASVLDSLEIGWRCEGLASNVGCTAGEGVSAGGGCISQSMTPMGASLDCVGTTDDSGTLFVTVRASDTASCVPYTVLFTVR